MRIWNGLDFFQRFVEKVRLEILPWPRWFRIDYEGNIFYEYVDPKKALTDVVCNIDIAENLM